MRQVGVLVNCHLALHHLNRLAVIAVGAASWSVPAHSLVPNYLVFRVFKTLIQLSVSHVKSNEKAANDV